MVNGMSNEYHLNQMFELLYNSLQILPKYEGKSKKIYIEEIKVKDYSRISYLKPILEIVEYITEHLHEHTHMVILQGSMADLGYVKGWSDVDIIYVLKTESVKYLGKYRDLFVKLEEFLYKIDSHQHHGIQYITEKDLEYYPDVFFPSNLYKYSKIIVGPYNHENNKYTKSGYLSLNVRPSQINKDAHFISIYKRIKSAYDTDILKHHSKNSVYLDSNYTNEQCMYQLKYYLSLIMLLPTLWLNLAGIHCTKKESFTYAKVFLSEENWSFIEDSSTVRKEWEEREYKFGSTCSDLIPNWVKTTLGYDYFKRGWLLVGEMFDRYSNILSFNNIKNYYDAMILLCIENPGKNIALCGSVKEPGLSDLDFLVLDEEPIVSESVREYFKPLDKYGGEVLVCPSELYPDIPYILNLRITPLQGTFPPLNKPTLDELKILREIEIIEWLPERLLRVQKILRERLYDSDKLHLITKSLYRSINMAAEHIPFLTKVEYIKSSNKTKAYENLEKSYKIALWYNDEIEKYASIYGNATGKIDICDYYTIHDDEFSLLKIYLHKLVSFNTNLSKKLSERININCPGIKMSIKHAELIAKRWDICSKLYDWFVVKKYTKGMMKWGWLLT